MARIETCIPSKFDFKQHVRFGLYQGEAGEAEAITKLYRKIYGVEEKGILSQTRYPYPEVFDPVWIHAMATHPDILWWVVYDTESNRLIGSGTVPLYPEHNRAYVRGLLIDPDYQGLGVGSYAYTEAWKDLLNRTRHKIKIFWAENRTAHIKSQRIAEVCGFFPVGLLFNKDIFLDKRESDVLMVIYAMNALKNRRAEPLLISEVIPIYNMMARQFRLETVAPTSASTILANGYDVKTSITADKYKYLYCTYKANNEELRFVINPRTQTAEKTYFSKEIDPITLKTLLRSAMLSLKNNLYYMEAYVSAFHPEHQRIFSDLGFQATAYIPGWDVIDCKREDAIIFSWVRELPSPTSLKLTHRGNRIASLFIK